MATAPRKTDVEPTTNATAVEALGETVIPVEFAGKTYNVLPTSSWPYEVLEAFEESRLVAFLKGILGTQQHDAFKATKPTLGDVHDFVEAIQTALGIKGN